MQIEDKISLNAIKSVEDCSINSGMGELVKEKLLAFQAVGIGAIISPATSLFASIKNKIGTFFSRYSNSADIIKSNKDQFLKKVNSIDTVPKDLL